MRFRNIAAPVFALALTASLAACGSDDDTSTATTPAPVATAAPTDASAQTLNAADIEFAQGMIAHHQQAIEMAEIALDPAREASPEVIDLATRVQAAQDPEVDLITGWLTAAGEPVTMDVSEGHDMSSMEGMMTADQMDAMAAMTGTDFNTMWLEMMIAHHTGAISQSQAAKANGSDPSVRALADQIIAAQQAEVTEMQALLG